VKRLLRPQVIIPIIFGAALIAGMLSFANITKVLHLVEGFQHVYLLYFLLLMVAYEGVRAMQWHLLLNALGIRVPLRAQLFTFLGGEITKSLPIGNYFQNYLLTVAEGTDFGRSSAATTFTILIEVAVSLICLVLLGLGTWSGWIRPLIVFGLLGFAAIVWIVATLHKEGRPPRWLMSHELARMALAEFREFRAGAVDLWHPRVLLSAGALGAVYCLIGGIAFYMVALGMGITGVSLGDALAVYFFSLAVGLIFPLPVDIGVSEASGVGAFLAVGVDKSVAVSVVLVNRVLSIGAALAIALASLLVLHDELRAVLHGGHHDAPSADRDHRAERRDDRATESDDQPEDHRDRAEDRADTPLASTPQGDG
jgi:uncharacterized protein (TIRG00374 family)